MIRTMFAVGVILFFLSYVGIGTAFSDEGEPSRPAETVQQLKPVIVQRTVVKPVVVLRTVKVPVVVQHKSVQVPSTFEVADQIQMDLLVVELRGNVERALKEADFHEAPGSRRYISATGSSSGRESDWLKSQLQTMKTYADIEVLSRPHVKSLLGQPVEIQVNCEPPQIAYLVRTGNKTFELREAVAQPTLGVTISLTAQSDADHPGQIEISPLKISTTTFDGREPVPGVDLDVGKPIISTRRLETSIRVTDGGETSGIVLPGPSGRSAVLFLCVRRVPKEGAQILPNPIAFPASKLTKQVQAIEEYKRRLAGEKNSEDEQ